MYLGCVASNDSMWKETVVALSHHSLRGTEEHHGKFQSGQGLNWDLLSMKQDCKPLYDG